MTHFVYILECADTSLYVGCTNNLEKRLKEHNTSKQGAHYTKIRRPVFLRYSEAFPNLKDARAREAALKRLSREKKLMIISQRPGNGDVMSCRQFSHWDIRRDADGASNSTV